MRCPSNGRWARTPEAVWEVLEDSLLPLPEFATHIALGGTEDKHVKPDRYFCPVLFWAVHGFRVLTRIQGIPIFENVKWRKGFPNTFMHIR